MEAAAAVEPAPARTAPAPPATRVSLYIATLFRMMIEWTQSDLLSAAIKKTCPFLPSPSNYNLLTAQFSIKFRSLSKMCKPRKLQVAPIGLIKAVSSAQTLAICARIL